MIVICPGPSAGLALLLGFAIVPIIALFGRVIVPIDSASKRFLSAVGFCVIVWLVGLVTYVITGTPIFWYDFLAGLMILFTATVAFGILWSLVCWGFTTSLLSALSKMNGPTTRDNWFQAYGVGTTIEEFTEDRLSILLGLRIARTNGLSLVALTGKPARVIAWFVFALRKFYGIPNF